MVSSFAFGFKSFHSHGDFICIWPQVLSVSWSIHLHLASSRFTLASSRNITDHTGQSNFFLLLLIRSEYKTTHIAGENNSFCWTDISGQSQTSLFFLWLKTRPFKFKCGVIIKTLRTSLQEMSGSPKASVGISISIGKKVPSNSNHFPITLLP